MNPYYSQVADRAAHRCEYCHAPELVFNFPFEVEHIIPLSKGGVDADLTWLCPAVLAIFAKALALAALILTLVLRLDFSILGKINGMTIFR